MATEKDEPGLADVIRAAVAAAKGCIRTALPAIVVSYDQTKQTAEVQVLIESSHLDDGGNRVFELPEPISNCPVVWPSSEAGFSFTFPLAPGDPCMLMVSDRSTDEWRLSESVDQTHQPTDIRRFNLGDAWVIPGGRPPSLPLPAAAVDSSAMVLRAPAIKLGSAAAASKVSLAPLIDGQLSALESVFTAWVPVPTDGGLALKTLLTTLISGGWPSSSASSKVEAE